ncbi:hypothetical protein POM88_005970 [Heracleum sosnowskyi]|uniref:Uncharacterized protein n=1 Tax=Heracleum sosnowskyi TaxID=360622 RepID=A0AAD8N4V1_9APIA|nr:hypothetical protein POM88_005970 [Heracleum sosnowskyi]
MAHTLSKLGGLKNNVECLPIDMIITIMQLLLGSGFEGFFNFFIAWARSQRPCAIGSLIAEFPVCALYKFGAVGSVTDKLCFARFFRIAERLGNADAILYARCKAILRGEGSAEVHFTVLNGLANEGHFLSMIGNISLHNRYYPDAYGEILRGLSAVFNHPYYNNFIVPALTDLRSLKTAISAIEIGHEAESVSGCPIHLIGLESGVNAGHGIRWGCLMCSISPIVNALCMS